MRRQGSKCDLFGDKKQPGSLVPQQPGKNEVLTAIRVRQSQEHFSIKPHISISNKAPKHQGSASPLFLYVSDFLQAFLRGHLFSNRNNGTFSFLLVKKNLKNEKNIENS